MNWKEANQDELLVCTFERDNNERERSKLRQVIGVRL